MMCPRTWFFYCPPGALSPVSKYVEKSHKKALQNLTWLDLPGEWLTCFRHRSACDSYSCLGSPEWISCPRCLIEIRVALSPRTSSSFWFLLTDPRPWMVTWLLPTSCGLLPPLSLGRRCSLGLPSAAPSPCSMNHSSHLSPHSSALKSLTFPSFLWMRQGACRSNWHNVTQCMVRKNASSESKMFISLMFQGTILIEVISFLGSWEQWEFTQYLSWMSSSLAILLCLLPTGNFHLMFQHKFLLHEQFFLVSLSFIPSPLMYHLYSYWSHSTSMFYGLKTVRHRGSCVSLSPPSHFYPSALNKLGPTPRLQTVSVSKCQSLDSIT